MYTTYSHWEYFTHIQNVIFIRADLESNHWGINESQAFRSVVMLRCLQSILRIYCRYSCVTKQSRIEDPGRGRRGLRNEDTNGERLYSRVDIQGNK